MIIMLILSSVDIETKYCSAVLSVAEAGTTAADRLTKSTTSISERILFFIIIPPDKI